GLTTAGTMSLSVNGAIALTALTAVTSMNVTYGVATSLSIPALLTAGAINVDGGAANATYGFAAPSMTAATSVRVGLSAGAIGANLHALQTGSIWIPSPNLTSLDTTSAKSLVSPPGGTTGCGALSISTTPCGGLFLTGLTFTPAFPALTHADYI